jgi:5-formyltetrahydrofolate cyclo-ligase
VNQPVPKSDWRRELRSRWQSLSDEERSVGAVLICRRLKEQACWQQARTVLLFAPLPDEVNLWPLLEDALAEGKNVALPRHDPAQKHYVASPVINLQRDLSTGAFGIREPASHCQKIDLSTVDLALVPGVGFDLNGNRLGRGKGFYDRLLADLGGIKCGVALDEQITEILPTEGHDVQMDLVLTGTRIVWRK